MTCFRGTGNRERRTPVEIVVRRGRALSVFKLAQRKNVHPTAKPVHAFELKNQREIAFATGLPLRRSRFSRETPSTHNHYNRSRGVTVSGGAFRQVDQNRRVRGVQRADGVAHRAGAVRGLVGAERDRRRVAARVHDGRGRRVHVLLDGRRHQSGDRHRHVSGA